MDGFHRLNSLRDVEPEADLIFNDDRNGRGGGEPMSGQRRRIVRPTQLISTYGIGSAVDLPQFRRS